MDDVRLAAIVASGLMLGPAVGDDGQFSSGTDLVVLHVLVKDRNGAYVTGLTRETFAVFEDGRPRDIVFFAREDEPVTVGLIIDSSGSMQNARSQVVSAAEIFATTSHPEDEFFALAFNEQVRVALPPASPFTTDAAVFRAAVAGAFAARGRTALYDAIGAGLDYARHGTHLRRVLVVLSDGGDNASLATFDQLAAATHSSDTVVYAIGLVDPLDREANPKTLKRLAHASGGDAFFPRDIDQIGEVLRRIAEDIRNTYTIGYDPGDAAHDGRFHRIRVSITAPEHRRAVVRTRQGFTGDRRHP